MNQWIHINVDIYNDNSKVTINMNNCSSIGMIQQHKSIIYFILVLDGKLLEIQTNIDDYKAINNDDYIKYVMTANYDISTIRHKLLKLVNPYTVTYENKNIKNDIIIYGFNISNSFLFKAFKRRHTTTLNK